MKIVRVKVSCGLKLCNYGQVGCLFLEWWAKKGGGSDRDDVAVDDFSGLLCVPVCGGCIFGISSSSFAWLSGILCDFWGVWWLWLGAQ